MGCRLLALFSGALALAILSESLWVLADSPRLAGAAVVFFVLTALVFGVIFLLILFADGTHSRKLSASLAIGYGLYYLFASLDGGRLSGLEVWGVLLVWAFLWMQYRSIVCLARDRGLRSQE